MGYSICWDIIECTWVINIKGLGGCPYIYRYILCIDPIITEIMNE